jgi:GNAT superfamily N-acetyltransferase
VLLDAEASPEAVAALAPCLEGVSSGLIRSPAAGVERLWQELSGRGRRAIVDRLEVGYRLDLPAPEGSAIADPRASGGAVSVREARGGDLEDLVIAARASLREEGRPDPFHGDPEGFRAWVRGRLPRARVAEQEGRVVFVAYADVQRPEGWLLQGVYTWPDRRRRGFARAGVAALARAAAEADAAHVQLAVVRGNRPAERLYEGLGFRPFQTLRTILFG